MGSRFHGYDPEDHRKHIGRDTAGFHFRHGLNHQRTRLFTESDELLLSCTHVLLLYYLHVSLKHLVVSTGQPDRSSISHLYRTRTFAIYRRWTTSPCRTNICGFSVRIFAFSVQRIEETPNRSQSRISKRTPPLRQDFFIFLPLHAASSFVFLTLAVIRNGI